MRVGMLAVGFVAAVAAHAQSGAAGFFNPLSATQNGVHLYEVSVHGGYFTGGTPIGVPTVGAGTQSMTGPFTIANASAAFGWSRSGERSSFSVNYSPSYVVYPDQTELNAMGHSFSMNWNRKFGQKWSVGASATGLIANQEQSYFSSNAFGTAASLPTTFEDLAGAVLLGKFTDAQLAAALTGTSARLLPEQTYLYGHRIGSGSLQAGLTYAASERMSFHFSVSMNRAQGLNSGNSGDTVSKLLIPKTTTSNMSFGWGYSVSPRTNIGIEIGTVRTFSRLQDGYASNASVSVGHRMSQHWLLQARAGGGLITYTRQSFTAPKKPQYTVGGSIGYKLRSHTLLAAYDRDIGDAYGLGAGTTSSATAGWAWKAPGSSWSLRADYGYQRTDGSSLLNTESWRATGGVGRSLTNHLFLSVQYAYFTNPPLQGSVVGLLGAESGVSMGLTWSPSQYR